MTLPVHNMGILKYMHVQCIAGCLSGLRYSYQ